MRVRQSSGRSHHCRDKATARYASTRATPPRSSAVPHARRIALSRAPPNLYLAALRSERVVPCEKETSAWIVRCRVSVSRAPTLSDGGYSAVPRGSTRRGRRARRRRWRRADLHSTNSRAALAGPALVVVLQSARAHASDTAAAANFRLLNVNGASRALPRPVCCCCCCCCCCCTSTAIRSMFQRRVVTRRGEAQSM